ncbi:MAG: hypothetical protein AAGE80_10240 [Pseudomonadota bacterium]
MTRLLLYAIAMILLTLLTQLGGIAWIAAQFARRKLVSFVFLYLVLWAAATQIAPQFGRVPLSCFPDSRLRMANIAYCALNRNYVSPELREVLTDTAYAVASRYPDAETLVLDANFPFIEGFPLLPHLSHQDGKSADLAFYYQDDGGTYLPGRMRSPIGYFAFEDGPSNCPPGGTLLRWNLRWLQPVWPKLEIEPERTRLALDTLASDPRVRRIFLEPHLEGRLRLARDKIRFQGCHAARHDDHIHIQL